VLAPARILLVEDEAAIRLPVARALSSEGYVVRDWRDGGEGDLATVRPDLAILDVMLPGEDGFSLARRLRGHDDVPVLFLTARDDVASRLEGFDAGADDYVIKPFVLEELLARVRALLRRSGRVVSDVVELGELIVDEGAGEALRGGAPLGLTATELRLLSFLARHPGQTLSKLQILTQVWGYEGFDVNLVEVHVSALRRKLEAHGPRVLHTVRGLGYRLVPA
jgi:two-component system, OmpR family, response regulator